MPASDGSVRATSTANGRRMSAPKGGIVRRLKRRFQAGDVLLFTDWTLLRVRGAKAWAAVHFSLAPARWGTIFVDVPPPSFSDLSRPKLEALVVELRGKVAALEKIVGEQCAEIARLKGLKGRPAIKPSGMDKATEPVKPAEQAKRRLRGKVTPGSSLRIR